MSFIRTTGGLARLFDLALVFDLVQIWACARQRDAICAVYSGFFLFIVDGKLAISAPRKTGPGA